MVPPITSLVTGAAGFIGSHVVDELVQRGQQVVAIDDLSGGFRDNVNPRAQFVEGTVLDPTLIEKLFRAHKFDYVFHLAAYAAEYGRTGFQGGLQWYRCRTTGRFEAELELFSGRAIAVPCCFISGASDWGIQQSPGALEEMQGTSCTDLRFIELIPGAGHWVQQEQPEAVVRHLGRFLAGLASDGKFHL